jgi:hypothetical protein
MLLTIGTLLHPYVQECCEKRDIELSPFRYYSYWVLTLYSDDE